MNNAKKILVLLGSPRKKGNSTTLAKQIAQGAESAGAEVETVYLNGLDIKPCQGCYACKKKDSKGCVVDDDMQSLYPKIIACGRVGHRHPGVLVQHDSADQDFHGSLFRPVQQ